MSPVDSITAIVERCKSISETPEYLANAQRLTGEWAEQSAQSASLERRIALQSSGVPEEHWSALDTPKSRPAHDAVARFLAGPPELRFLVLSGPKGVGKSFALSWAVHKRGGQFTSAQALVFAGSFDREVWEPLFPAPVLALDEIGAEQSNAAYDASLYELLNRRYSANRKTVLATNLDQKGFRARYLGLGLDRLLDRLRTGGEWVTLPGESIRKHWSERDREVEL
jgi:DNA replication protein DnaC